MRQKKNFHLCILSWNNFSEPKNTKDEKEAEVEDGNLEKAIEKSYPNDIGLESNGCKQCQHQIF